jgi:tetratricopeptide (TPR) repeat protein
MALGFSSGRELARTLNFSPAYVARVLSGKQVPSQEFAQHADDLLKAGGALMVLFEAARYETMARVTQLPPGPRPFVGRDSELEELDQLLLDDAQKVPSVVVVDGPPGVGKTSTALTWAHQAQHEFDGALWVDLRGYSAGTPAEPGEILESLLLGAGVSPQRMPPETRRRASLLASLLYGRRMLVILDNALGEEQVRPVLAAMATCAVLITSRKRLSGVIIDPGADSLTLPPLRHDEAVALLRDRIGEDRSSTSPAALRTVVRLCAQLPLAVRIAAEKIAANPFQSVDELAEQLAADAKRLRTLELPEMSVRAAFAWSYRTLPARSRQLFRLLGLHPGATFSAEAAAALLGAGQAGVRMELDELTSAHLVRAVSATHFAMHDLIRAFAADEASQPVYAGERVAAVRRLVEWYWHATGAAFKALVPNRDHQMDLGTPADGVPRCAFASFDSAFRWFAGEIGNVTGVSVLACEYGLFEMGWRIPVFWLDYLMFARPWETWVSSQTAAIAAAEAGNDALGIARASVNLAEVHRRLHRLDAAGGCYRVAAELADSIGPDVSTVWAYIGLGNIAHELGDYAEAAAKIERGMVEAKRIGYAMGEATARVHLGRSFRALGDRERAFEHGKQALDWFTAEQDEQGRGYAAAPLARAYRHFGLLEQALTYSEIALAAYRASGHDLWGEADALDERGRALALLGEPEQARACWVQAKALVQDVDQAKADVIQTQLDAMDESGP